jgi:hypothetical protein
MRRTRCNYTWEKGKRVFGNNWKIFRVEKDDLINATYCIERNPTKILAELSLLAI